MYAPVLSAGTDLVFRWGLSQVIDTRGNTATYSWVSDLLGGSWEALDTIAYNGTTVRLRQQYTPGSLRPQHILEAIERHRDELQDTDMIRTNVR